MLYSKIPAEKIHLGKRVVTLKQDADKVSVQCKDDSVYEADILIGADGANSAVRKCLFKALKNEGKLLASDDLALPFNCLCLVGQTGILDPEAFPELKKENSTFNSMSAVGKPFSVKVPFEPLVVTFYESSLVTDSSLVFACALHSHLKSKMGRFSGPLL